MYNKDYVTSQRPCDIEAQQFIIWENSTKGHSLIRIFLCKSRSFDEMSRSMSLFWEIHCRDKVFQVPETV